MITPRVTPWTPKLAYFVVPSLIGGSALWFFVQQALRGHVIFTEVALLSLGLFFIFGLFCLSMWLSPILVVPYIASWRSIRLTVSIAAAVPVLFFFPPSIWTVAAFVLMALGISISVEVIADDIHHRLSVKVLHTLPRGISHVILAFIIVVSLLYYQQIRGSSSTTDELSNRFIDQTVTLSERLLPTVYKAYEPGMTIDELIGAQIPTGDSILKDIRFDAFTNQAEQQRALQQRLEEIGLDAGTVTVDVAQSEAQVRQDIDDALLTFRRQTIDQAREELATRLNVPVQGSDTVHETLIHVVGRQFDTYVRRWVTFMPMLLGVALFFALRVFTSLFQAVVVWCAWLFVRLYRATKILKVTQQTVPAEKVEWNG